jgi:hypothetical protein
MKDTKNSSNKKYAYYLITDESVPKYIYMFFILGYITFHSTSFTPIIWFTKNLVFTYYIYVYIVNYVHYIEMSKHNSSFFWYKNNPIKKGRDISNIDFLHYTEEEHIEMDKKVLLSINKFFFEYSWMLKIALFSLMLFAGQYLSVLILFFVFELSGGYFLYCYHNEYLMNLKKILYEDFQKDLYEDEKYL